jgi:hypothetical protein
MPDMNKVSLFVPIMKTSDAQRVVKGPVLRPDIEDRQGSVISAMDIEEAAHRFMLKYVEGNATTGFMHRDFDRARSRFPVVESYVTTIEETIPRDNRAALPDDKGNGDIVIPKGSWMLAVKVLDEDVWAAVQNGVIKGFSIGAMAKRTYEE